MAYVMRIGDWSSDVCAAELKAGRARDQAVLADADVVSDLYQVVDLRAAPDHRGADVGAVDGGVGADLDIVADPDRADRADAADVVHGRLDPVAARGFVAGGLCGDEAEAVGAEARSEEHTSELQSL